MSADAADAIVAGAADAIISINSAQRIVQFNPAAVRLFGISSAEAIGQPIERFVPHRFRQDHTAQVQEYARTGVTHRSPWHPLTVMALRADGTEFAAEASLSRSTLDGDSLFTVFVRDVTQRRQAETQLQRARTMDAVAQLAAGVAHDFNNLLMVILGNLELMETAQGDERLLKSFGREAKSAAERGTALGRQLLAFSRRSPLPRQPADLIAVVARNEAELRRLAGPTCKLEILADDDAHVVECNSPQLVQVLVSLVSNARDAMADGGTITIHVDRIHLDDSDGARWPTLSTGAYVRLRVSDSGAGLSEEARRRAFEPFFTTKPAGHATGLGLAAVFGIANQLGGSVDAENNSDAGTTFTVLLPESDKPVADDAGSGDAHRRRGHGVILLVDDEAAVRATIQMILTRNGYSVIEAANGREALDIYHQNGGRINLVLTDLRMPEMDGRSLVAELRAHRPSLPVLMMTGYDDAADAITSTVGRPEVTLSKPFTAPALLDAIAERIG
jgi:PAS domain S-box-containing protein